ncbi:Ig-like domain-containing protein [Opitutales bacterium]|nr:Ig-like domain-containing protein [Opitutales bacterium]
MEDNPLTIYLDGNLSGSSSDSFSDWKLIIAPGGNQGSTAGVEDNNATSFKITFDPATNFEGNATFQLESREYGTDINATHNFTIEMSPDNDPPRICFVNEGGSISYGSIGSNNSYSIPENQLNVGYLLVHEYDFSDDVNITIDANQSNNRFFAQPILDSTFISNNTSFPNEKRYSLSFKNSKDYELDGVSNNNFRYELKVWARDGNGGDVNQTLTLTITDVDEAPIISPSSRVDFSITEDMQGDNDGSFYRNKFGYSEIKVTTKDRDDTMVLFNLSTLPTRGKVYYSTSDPGSTPPVNQLTGAQVPLTTDQIWVDYRPDGNQTGNENFTVRFTDEDDVTKFSELPFIGTISSVTNDPPMFSGSLTSPHTIVFEEEQVNSVAIIDLNANDGDPEHTEGGIAPNGNLRFEVLGTDEDFFHIDSLGVLTFKNKMSFEDKNDSNNDNFFNITVRVNDPTTDSTDSTTYDELDLVVKLTDKNEQPVITIGGDFANSFTIPEDGNWPLPPNWLSASDVDAGDTLTWSVQFSQGGSLRGGTVGGSNVDPTFTYDPMPDFPFLSTGEGNETLTVTVSDGSLISNSVTITATVSATEDPPRITQLRRGGEVEDVNSTVQRVTFRYPENSFASDPIIISASEVDGEQVEFESFDAGNKDITFFKILDLNDSISPFTASIKFENGFSPNYEDANDSNYDNNYSLRIRVKESNKSTSFDDIYLDILITDQDEPAEIGKPDPVDIDSRSDTYDDYNITMNENQKFITTMRYKDPDQADANKSYTWNIQGGVDEGFFEVNASTGVLSFIDNLGATGQVGVNFEDKLDEDHNNTYEVEINLIDPSGAVGSQTKKFHIKIEDVNDPAVVSTPLLSLLEPAKTNSTFQLSQYVSDEDNRSGLGADTITWGLKEVSSVFKLEQNGSLSFQAPSDYESNDTSFSLVVQAFDGTTYVDANFSIQVNEDNEPPEFYDEFNSTITYRNYTTQEEIPISINLSQFAKDPENDAITYSHKYNNADGEIKFFIPSDGSFTFIPKANFSDLVILDFNASDGNGNKKAFTVNIRVTEVADPPVVYNNTSTPGVIDSSKIFERIVAENNGTLVADLNASDPNDTPSSTNFIWTLSGVDHRFFKMNPTQGPSSKLEFLNVPNFEANGSDASAVGHSYIYDFNMTVQDDGNATIIPVKVTVGNQPEDPYFDYGDGNQTVTFFEGTIGTVFDANVSDVENSPITYGLTGNGPDDANFSINPNTGAVSFKSVPDYEAPWGGSDTNTTNTYILEVNATDDVAKPGKIKHFVIVNVINVIEPPRFEDTNFNAVGSVFIKDTPENSWSGYDINATTEDVNQSLILEISGGADKNMFRINVATKNLYWSNPNGQDFENPISADGDNNYEVQVSIFGTNITQDFTYTVTDKNDAPTIVTTGLTEFTLDENIPFVVNLDTIDQDGGGEFPDILYTVDSNSTRFIEHNNSAVDITNLFNDSSSGSIDLNLNDASFSTFGDLNNDASMDVLVLGKNSISYFEGDGTGSFEKNASHLLNSVSVVGPDHAVICDLDQDGDKDVLISLVSSSKIELYKNRGGLTVGEFDPSTIINDSNRLAGKPEFFTVGDIDNDYDLDIIVAYQESNEVVWYANDGNSTFTEAGVITSVSSPRYLELIDANDSSSLGDHFKCPDIVIAGANGIYLAENAGKGVFTTSKIIDFLGQGEIVRAVNLDGNDFPDLVYATTLIGSPPSYSLQDSTGFSLPIVLLDNSDDGTRTISSPSAIEIYTGPFNPAGNYKGPTKSSPAIIVSDRAKKFISIYETSTDNTSGVKIERPVVLNVPDEVTSIALVDLTREDVDYLSYEFTGGADEDLFDDIRIKNDGSLFFKSPPDYEDKKDQGGINRYRVKVKVSDNNGGEFQQMVTVNILDVNEPPVIITLDGNDTSIIEHFENLTAVIDVNVTHEEKATQSVSFSIVGGADQAKFHIVPETGQLSFISAPDFEANASSDNNNTYKVSIRATDNGVGAAFDEQHIIVQLQNGTEPPEFNNTIQNNLFVSEDVTLPLQIGGPGSDINATDGNGTILDLAGFRILTNGMNGNATITGSIPAFPLNFNYIPDGNFTGTDTVVLEVNNTAGLKDTLTLNITVNPVDDPPSIQTPALINHPENQNQVVSFTAVDDNNATLTWSWVQADANYTDYLQLDSDGSLVFRRPYPDYEIPNNFNNQYNISLQVSDGNRSVEGNFTILITNLNDNIPLSTHLFSDQSSYFTVMEGENFVVDLNATDADSNPITYTRVGGADKDSFDFIGSKLHLKPAQDFETPASANNSNRYELVISLSDTAVDGNSSMDYRIFVDVTDKDELPPTFSNSLDPVSKTLKINHPENKLDVVKITASDNDKLSVLSFSIAGGADKDYFDVNASTGWLYFLLPPDKEAARSAEYEVKISVSDGTSSALTTLTVDVTVTNVDELPSVSPSLFSTTEDVAIPINFTVADPEGEDATFSVVTEPLYGTWTGSGNNFTYTPSSNYHGSDSVTLRVTDGTSQFDTLVNLEVNAANDLPTAVNDEFFYDDPNFGTLGLDVLANDSNAPDQNGTETLSISSFSQPNDGIVSLPPGTNILSFKPSDSFIGITTFNYTVWDGSYDSNSTKSESNGTVDIVVSRASSLPSWRFLKKFGFYNQTTQDWIFHNDLGWLYINDTAGVATYTWMWHEDMGWFWTGNTYFPDLYLNDLARWMSWKGSRTTGNSWTIYDQVGKEWLDSEKFKVARLNTVFSKLKNIDQVIDFVNTSPLFTDEERNAIIDEFVFTGTSSTLLSKGFTLAF